jgi:uncharacterized protein YjcR
MGEVCSTHEAIRKPTKLWLQSLKDKDHSEDLGVDVDNIKMILKEIGWEGMAWILLAQDRVQRLLL